MSKFLPRRGFNGCFDQAIEALRFLADHPRPVGGEQRYNAAHLLPKGATPLWRITEAGRAALEMVAMVADSAK